MRPEMKRFESLRLLKLELDRLPRRTRRHRYRRPRSTKLVRLV